MKRIILSIGCLILVLLFCSTYSKSSYQYPIRNLELGHGYHVNVNDFSDRALSELSKYESKSENNKLSFNGNLSYSKPSNQLSTENEIVNQYIDAFYDIETNHYYVNYTLDYGNGEIKVIEYNLNPQFSDGEKPDIIFEIDGKMLHLSNLFIKKTSIENLCSPFGGNSPVLSFESGDCFGGDYGGGGAAVISLFAIIIIPLAEQVIEFVVDAVTTIITQIKSFFKWITTVDYSTIVIIVENSYTFTMNGTTFEAVEAKSEVLSKLDDDKFYFAIADYDGMVYIAPKEISLQFAASILATDQKIISNVKPSNPNVQQLLITPSIYTFYDYNAREAAWHAGGGVEPTPHPFHGNKGMQFKHFHPAGREHAHALYGSFIIVL